jgi:hypothetical protein
VRSAKLKIPRMDLLSRSIREYRMECTGDTRRTVHVLAALPDSIGASNRGW